MGHLLREAVVPGFFINRERPSLRRAGFFHCIAVTALAVGMNGVAAKQVGIGDAFAAIDFGAIVHAAGLGPALLGDGRRLAVHFENERAGIVAFGLIAVNVGAHVSINALHARLTALLAS